jgi:two-component system phosphate regulon sensor histidine kinase PhoR
VAIDQLIISSVEVERHRAESLGLKLTTNVPDDLPAVRGDFEALQRVVRGLIDNAIKYTPEGGEISVSAERAGMLAIVVSDTGTGISETDLPHIFDKFYRAGSDPAAREDATAAPGVGLGLYLTQHVVVQLDGEVKVESKQGVGTTFTVLLPLWIEKSAGEKDEENANVKALVGS